MRTGRVSLGSVVLGVLAAGCQPQEKTPAETQTVVQVTGVNEQLLQAATLVALPPPGVAPADLPAPDSDGAKYLAEFCIQCHNLPSPTTHSATDWPSVARRMWLRMDMLPTSSGVKLPTTQQRQVLLGYLVQNALQVSGAALPQGPGRATFSEVCSKCHGLPDPRQHSPADWPAVVMRMEERMTQMKVNRPTSAQVQEIIGYLNRVSAR